MLISAWLLESWIPPVAGELQPRAAELRARHVSLVRTGIQQDVVAFAVAFADEIEALRAEHKAASDALAADWSQAVAQRRREPLSINRMRASGEAIYPTRYSRAARSAVIDFGNWLDEIDPNVLRRAAWLETPLRAGRPAA